MVDYRTKMCSECREVKSTSEFYKQSARLDGLSSQCKECKDAQQRKYRSRPEVKERIARYKTNKRHRYWAQETLSSHRKRGVEVNMSIDELETLAIRTTACEICGTKLCWEKGRGFTNSSPTLDRMGNEPTIEEKNILILCRRCNTSKSDRTLNEFVDYCRQVVNWFGE